MKYSHLFLFQHYADINTSNDVLNPCQDAHTLKIPI